MSKERITVRPVAGGWSLENKSLQYLIFHSVASAERSARMIAAIYANRGIDTAIDLADLSGAVVGVINYYSPEAMGADADGSLTPYCGL